ncbi:MAG: prepilin-type N-terminal cleavage/methylation domain-containing protein [Deltaproteobacteria bacterium]|nr:prepilin-type N-terminal cleavage/methylation domain-containing protein [Deltaproteobacteria bacterium]
MKRSHGFTLLEILVAVAILSIGLVAVMGMQGNTMMTSRRAELTTIATWLAKKQMVELELQVEAGLEKGEFPEDTSGSGTFDPPYEDYRWKYEISRVTLPAPPEGQEEGGGGNIETMIGKQLTEEISKSVRELKLTIVWEEDGKEDSIDVVTHVVKL